METLSRRTATDTAGKTIGVDLASRGCCSSAIHGLVVRFHWIGADGAWQLSAAHYAVPTFLCEDQWSKRSKGHGLAMELPSNSTGNGGWAINAETKAHLEAWVRECIASLDV
jgi:hypothetical protein